MSLRFKFLTVVLLVLTIVSIALIIAVGGALKQAKTDTSLQAKRLTEELLQERIDSHFAKTTSGLMLRWLDSVLSDSQRQQPIEIRRALRSTDKAFRDLRIYLIDADSTRSVSGIETTDSLRPIASDDALAAIDLASLPSLATPAIDHGKRVCVLLHEDQDASIFVAGELASEPFELPEIKATDVDVSSLQRAVTYPLVMGGFLLLMVLLFALWRLVIAPLRTLDEASRRIARGDYSHEVPTRFGSDEMARLVKTFNLMQKEVRDYQNEMEKRIEDAKEEISRKERTLVVAQRLAATGTLAAGLAHEINNPLGGMKNAARRLKKGVEDARQIEYLELIEEGLERIEALMAQILDFSRRRDAAPEHFQYADVVNKALGFVRHRFDERVRLEVEIPENLPEGYGMPPSIQQVIINLLINARDAMPEKGVVKLSLSAVEDGVELIVADNGSGMDDETVERIFDPFYTTKEPGKGTGLGLSIVHNIVANHDGILSVQSRLGEGTTFTLLFPKHPRETAIDRVLRPQDEIAPRLRRGSLHSETSGDGEP